MGKLTDKGIRAIKEPGKYADGDGLALIVKESGAKLWWFRFRFAGKEKTFSIGVYPVVGLKDARARTFEARKMLADGIDPVEKKKEDRAAMIEKENRVLNTIKVVGDEWIGKFGQGWTEKHYQKIERWLAKDVYPSIGKLDANEVGARDLLNLIQRIEDRGANDTAHRVLQVCGQILRYAVVTGRAERDVSADLKGALAPAVRQNMGAITEPDEVGDLLRNIDEYAGSAVVRQALRLAPLVFVRPGELRNAKWDEFDFAKKQWIIPAARMKMRKPHVVPLAKQAIILLDELRALHGSDYLFPSPNSATRPLSDMALLSAIRRMGYTPEEMTAHGFRALASTNLEHLGFDSRLIELQLAHADRDGVRVAYKRDAHLLRLKERTEMMQAWAGWLDDRRMGVKVV